MIDIKQSTSASTDVCKVSTQSHSKENMVVGEKEIQACSSDETVSSLKKNATVSTTSSSDSSNCGENLQLKSSSIKLVCERLYFQSKERSKRLEILAGEDVTASSKSKNNGADIGFFDSIKTSDIETLRQESERVRIIHSNGLIAMRLAAKRTGNVRKSVTQKNNNTLKGETSISEITGKALYLEANHRKKRLDKLRRKHHDHQPRLYFEAATKSSLLLSSKGYNSNPRAAQANVDDDCQLIKKGKMPASVIAGCALHAKAVQRQKRLEKLRKKYREQQEQEHRPKLHLEAAAQSSLMLSKKGYKLNPNVTQTNNSGDNNTIEQRGVSVSEIAGQALHVKAVQRQKRLEKLRKKRHEHRPKLHLEATAKSSSLLSSTGYNPNNSVAQTDADDDQAAKKVKASSSVIAGCALHMQATERQKRIEKLRKAYQNYRPELRLEAAAKSSSMLSMSKRYNNIKLNTDDDYTVKQGNPQISPTSVIAGCALYEQAIIRKKRMDLLRKKTFENQPRRVFVCRV